MITTWKRQATEGLASTFSGKAEAVQATGEASHPRLSIMRQCALLRISRSGRYDRPMGESEQTLALMRLTDEAFPECPYYGARQMMRHLYWLGHRVSRGRVRRSAGRR